MPQLTDWIQVALNLLAASAALAGILLALNEWKARKTESRSAEQKRRTTAMSQLEARLSNFNHEFANHGFELRDWSPDITKTLLVEGHWADLPEPVKKLVMRLDEAVEKVYSGIYFGLGRSALATFRNSFQNAGNIHFQMTIGQDTLTVNPYLALGWVRRGRIRHVGVDLNQVSFIYHGNQYTQVIPGDPLHATFWQAFDQLARTIPEDVATIHDIHIELQEAIKSYYESAR